jgi:hypothetical protein
VTDDDRVSSLVRDLAAALGEIEQADLECPEGVDRFLWSADLLDAMAQSVETIARIVDTHAASDASAVRERAVALAQAVIGQRNELVRYGRGARPDRMATSWPGPTTTPDAEGEARPRPTATPAQRLMEQEWDRRPSS